MQLKAVSVAVPKRIVSNACLSEMHPDWHMDKVFEKTGVESRFWIDEEDALDLAVAAFQKLQDEAGLPIQDLDCLIFCTQTPRYRMPQNSHLIHDRFQLPTRTMCFDLNLACSGFVHALALAQGLSISQHFSNVIIITADTYSTLMRDEDRSVRCLFGDGATASWLVFDETTRISPEPFLFETVGKYWDRFRTEIDSESHREYIKMDGLAVWSYSNDGVIELVKDFNRSYGYELSDFEAFIFHQGSKLTLDALTLGLDLSEMLVPRSLAYYGNTVSSSIPITLHKFISENAPRHVGRHKPLMLCGFGVGFSSGVCSLPYPSGCRAV